MRFDKVEGGREEVELTTMPTIAEEATQEGPDCNS